MPTSKIETELLKATKLDSDDYKKRQDMLSAILDEVNAFKDAKWEAMTEEAQLWVNSAIKAKKAEKRIPEFPDVGKVKPGDDDDDDEKPAKKKKKAEADDDDDDDDKPAKKKKKPAADDDDDDEKPAKKKKKPAADDDDDAEDDGEDDGDADDDGEDDDEKPKKKKKKPAADDDDDDDDKAKAKKKKKPAPEDDDDDDKPAKKKKKPAADDDDDDEKPAKKKKKPEAVPQKASGVKVAIKDAIIENFEISVDEIVKKLGKGGAEISKVTVSNVRAEFRHTLKLLKERGKLKGIEL